MKRFFFFCFVFGYCANMFAQGDIDEQNKIFYRNEISGAFLLNSNGWGLNFRRANRIDAANKVLYDIDFAILKHPKEYRSTSDYAYGREYVLGKQYIPMIFRGSFGKQKEIYRKFDVGGISIRRFISAGPSIALLKPIYYEINDNGNLVVEKFDPAIFNLGYYDPPIYGRASFFKGFDELMVVPGVFLKSGLSFEYSRQDKILHAIEIGAFAECFMKKLPIMATTENYQFYLSLFVSYRFGKVIDPTARKEKKQKKVKKEDFYF